MIKQNLVCVREKKITSQVISYLIEGMPNMPYLYAMDFINVLKKKHAAGGYKEMVKISFPWYIGNDAPLNS